MRYGVKTLLLFSELPYGKPREKHKKQEKICSSLPHFLLREIPEQRDSKVDKQKSKYSTMKHEQQLGRRIPWLQIQLH